MSDSIHQFKGKVKNIIFDLGGVLLRIDYKNVQREFEGLGIDNFQELYTQANQTSLFDDLECGRISNKVFLEELAKYLPRPVSHKILVKVWNSMLGEMPRERMELVYRLKNNYRTFLLSNTNAIHIAAFNEIIRHSVGLDYYKNAFEQTYYSSDIGMRKPDEIIFQKVCQWNNLQAKETLFIDDSQQHVLGAQKAGLNAYHLDLEKENVIDVLGEW